MQREKYRNIALIVSLLLPWNCVLLPAFIAGTQVTTPRGFVPIQNLYVGHKVIGCSPDSSIVETQVKTIGEYATDILAIVKTDTETVCASKEQYFYDPKLNKWIEVQYLTTDNTFIDYDGDYHSCLGIEFVNQPATMCELSLDRPHTYFVSESQLLTHNFLTIGIGVVWGTGVLAFDGITVALAALGIIAAVSAGSKSKQPTINVQVDPQVIVHSLSPGPNSPPNDPDKNKKKRKTKKTSKQHNNKKKHNNNNNNKHDNKKRKRGENNANRKINTTSKTESFKKLKPDYRYDKDGYHRRRSGAEGLGKHAEYVKWDALHNEIEVFNKMKKHIGAYDPATHLLYKSAKVSRTM